MMAKSLKKALSLILALVMCLGLVNLSALAAGSYRSSKKITVTVVNDDNENERIEGATVTLYKEDNKRWSFVEKKTTDGQGQATFEYNETGKRYKVVAEKDNDDDDEDFKLENKDKNVKLELKVGGSSGGGGAYTHIDIRLGGHFGIRVDGEDYTFISYINHKEPITVIDPKGVSYDIPVSGAQSDNGAAEFRKNISGGISSEWDDSKDFSGFSISGTILVSVQAVTESGMSDSLIHDLFGEYDVIDYEGYSSNRKTITPAGQYYQIDVKNYNPTENKCPGKAQQGNRGYDFEINMSEALYHLTDFVTVGKHVVDESGQNIDDQVSETFTFTLSNLAGSVNVTSAAVTAGGSYKFDGLEPGFYSITETAVSGYVPVKYDGTDWKDSGYVQYVQSADKEKGAATVTFYNMKLENKGTLEISKTVAGNRADGYSDRSYTFDIVNAAGTTVMTAAVKAGESAELFLPAGEYTVVETDPSVGDDEILTVTVNGSVITAGLDGYAAPPVTVAAKAKSGVAFTNTYTDRSSTTFFNVEYYFNTDDTGKDGYVKKHGLENEIYEGDLTENALLGLAETYQQLEDGTIASYTGDAFQYLYKTAEVSTDPEGTMTLKLYYNTVRFYISKNGLPGAGRGNWTDAIVGQIHLEDGLTSKFYFNGGPASNHSYFGNSELIGDEVPNGMITVTNEAIRAQYPAFDPATEYVYWYTIHEGKHVHVDGVVLKKGVPPMIIKKSVDKTTAQPGDTLTYTVSLTNGYTKAIGAVITDTIPDGLTLVDRGYSIAPAGTRYDMDVSGSTLTFSNIQVGAGQTVTVSFQATVPDDAEGGTQYTNTANVNTVDTNAVITGVELPATDVAIHYTWRTGDGFEAWPEGTSDPLPYDDAITTVSALDGYRAPGLPSIEDLPDGYAISGWYVLDEETSSYTLKTQDVVTELVKALKGGEAITLYAALTYKTPEHPYTVVYEYYYAEDGAAYPSTPTATETVIAAQKITQAELSALDVYGTAPATKMYPVEDGKTYTKGAGDTFAAEGTWECGNLKYTVRYYLNQQTKTDVTVTKTFSGIDTLPEGFQIAYTADVGAFSGTLTPSTGKLNGGTYTWTIPGVLFGTELTFTESGYDVTGYDVVTYAGGVEDVVTYAGGVKGVKNETSADLTVSAADKAVGFSNVYTGERYSVKFQVVDAAGNVIINTDRVALLNQSNAAMEWEKADSAATNSVAGWSNKGENKPGTNAASYTLVYTDYDAEKEIRISQGSGPENIWVTARDGYTWTGGSFTLKGAVGGVPTTYTSLGAVLNALAEYNKTAATKVYEITYQATVTQNTGSLTIEKSVGGLPAGTAQTYLFAVTGPSGAVKSEREDGFWAIEFTAENAGHTKHVTIPDLPSGEYTVTEQSPAAVPGYYLAETAYKVGDVNTSKTWVARSENGADSTVKVTNTYKKGNEGGFSLSFLKEVQGDGYTMSATGDFTFNVTEKMTGAATYTGTNDEHGTVTVSNIKFRDELGNNPAADATQTFTHTYTLTETADSIPGMEYDRTSYDVTVSGKWVWNSTDKVWNPEIESVTCGDLGVTKNTETETVTYLLGDENAVFINNYQMVILTVRKGYVNVNDLPADFAVDISSGDETVMTLTTGDEYVSHDTTYRFYQWNIKLPALAEGQRYTFTERNLGGAPTLTAQFGVWNEDREANTYTDLTVNGYSFSVALGEDLLRDETTEVRMTNTYTTGGAIVIPPDTPIVTPVTPVIPEPPITGGEIIEDEDVPMTDLPTEPAKPEAPVEIEDIEDEDVPMAEPEKTGDNLGLWFAGAAASGLGLVWMLLTGRKRRDEDA